MLYFFNYKTVNAAAQPMKKLNPEIALSLPAKPLDKLQLLVSLKLLDIHRLRENKCTVAGPLLGSDLDL